MSSHHDHDYEVSPAGQNYLARLSDLEYELEEDSPDVMGWDVADKYNEKFGRVDDLLVDMSSGQILFGIISYEMGDERQSTLVPLAGTQVDTDVKRLVLPMDSDSVKEAPAFLENTEDVQPYFEYWMSKIEEWAAPGEEEEVEQQRMPPS